MICLLDRGDFYSVYGRAAELAAKEIFRTRSVLKYDGARNDGTGIASCALSVSIVVQFLRLCLRRGERVQIYTSSRGSSAGFELTKQASPGDTSAIEEILGPQYDDDASAAVMAAVKIAVSGETRTVGICFCSTSMRQIGLVESEDNNAFSNLEAALIQLDVKECLLPTAGDANDAEHAAVASLLDRCNIPATSSKSAYFRTRDVSSELQLLVGETRWRASGELMERKLALSAAAALLQYLQLGADSTSAGSFALIDYDIGQYMRLDSAAVHALNLMPAPSDSRNMSLFGVLNCCRTAIGSRLLARWLKQPLLDREAIERRLSLVQSFFDDAAVRQNLREDHLRSVPDVNRLTRKLHKRAGSLEDVVRVYQLALRLIGFIECLATIQDKDAQQLIDSEFTAPLREIDSALERYRAMVETTIDLKALEHHEYIIKPSFDQELQQFRAKIDAMREEIHAEHEKTALELGIDTEKKLKLEQHSIYGWCFRLTRGV